MFKSSLGTAHETADISSVSCSVDSKMLIYLSVRKSERKPKLCLYFYIHTHTYILYYITW